MVVAEPAHRDLAQRGGTAAHGHDVLVDLGAAVAAFALDEAALGDGVIPRARVDVAVAAPGTPEDEVGFETPATLLQGRFEAELDASVSPYDVWARACLGSICGALRMPAG